LHVGGIGGHFVNEKTMLSSIGSISLVRNAMLLNMLVDVTFVN